MSFRSISAAGVFAALAVSLPLAARADTAAQTPPAAIPPTPAPQATPGSPAAVPAAVAADAAGPTGSVVKFGVDIYEGLSDLDGKRKYSDGMWIGAGPAYPSSIYVRGDNGKGVTGKFSVGTGSMYTGSTTTLKQPLEAWVQAPVKDVQVTVGKYYVPFEVQEWQYETKYGVQGNWSKFGDTISASENYNENLHTSNTYLRLGRALTPAITVGVSGGAGRGLSFDSPHDKGWAVYGTGVTGQWTLNTAYDQFTGGGSTFLFDYEKVSYGGAGRLKPSLALYHYDDGAGTLGYYRSVVYQVGYAVTPSITLQGGNAPTAKADHKAATWVEVHWAQEW